MANRSAWSRLVGDGARPSGGSADLRPRPPPPLAVLAATFIAPTVGANLFYVLKKQRPHPAWPVLGIVLGVGGVALGLGVALPNTSAPDATVAPGLHARASFDVAFGTVLAVVGVVSVALAIAALVVPVLPAETSEGAVRRLNWSISPIVARDAVGGPAVGVGLSIVSF